MKVHWRSPSCGPRRVEPQAHVMQLLEGLMLALDCVLGIRFLIAIGWGVDKTKEPLSVTHRPRWAILCAYIDRGSFGEPAIFKNVLKLPRVRKLEKDVVPIEIHRLTRSPHGPGDG